MTSFAFILGVVPLAIATGPGAELKQVLGTAVAIGMTGVTIFGEESVLAEAGIAVTDEQEDEVEKFREFLDTISPEDFQTGG